VRQIISIRVRRTAFRWNVSDGAEAFDFRFACKAKQALLHDTRRAVEHRQGRLLDREGHEGKLISHRVAPREIARPSARARRGTDRPDCFS
jgi:hypothetical protein